jgi:hypothetical protein
MISPWTHEELEEMKNTLEESINRTEAENPNIRPLPPMTLDEAKELLLALADTATVRVLTEDEAFLHGQLVAAYGMAVRAATLGHSGRYYVISEQDIARVAK